MCVHKFEQAWTFLAQFQGDVGRQLDRWRLEEWAQPVNECLKVEVLLDSPRYRGTTDIITEFKAQEYAQYPWERASRNP